MFIPLPTLQVNLPLGDKLKEDKTIAALTLLCYLRNMKNWLFMQLFFHSVAPSFLDLIHLFLLSPV